MPLPKLTGNDFLDTLTLNGLSKNPNYNPKTKKGRLEPQYTRTTTPADLNSGLFTAYAQSASDVDFTDKDTGRDLRRIEKDRDLGVQSFNQFATEKELNEARADKQSTFTKYMNAQMQGVINEVGLGTALSLANIVDAVGSLFSDESNDYTNPVASFIEGLQDQIKDRFEIYQKDPDASWAITDAGWWANNLVSAYSTASMLIPTMGITKGIGLITKLAGKASKYTKLGKGLAKVAKGAKAVVNPYKGISRESSIAGRFAQGFNQNAGLLGKNIENWGKYATAGFLSRTMENYMEARDVYKGVYDDALTRLNSMSSEEMDILIQNNPELKGKSNEEMAKYIAGESADETFKNDYAMLIFDILQYKSIGSLWKGASKGSHTAATRIANRNATKALTEEGKKALEKTGWLANRKEAIKHAFKHPLNSIGAIKWSEGIEEGYQGVQSEKGQEVAELMFDPTFNKRSLNSYMTDPKIWEQAFWGVIGGAMFQMTGSAVGNVYNKVKGKIDKAKSKLSDTDFAKTQITYNKQQQNEIEGRAAIVKRYADSMKLLNEGQASFKMDEVTGKIEFDPTGELKEVTPEDAEIIKTQLTNDFVTEMTMNAIDAGTYDLLEEYLNSEEINKFFTDLGVNVTAGEKSMYEALKRKMTDVYNNYSGTLSDMLDTVDGENESVMKLAARNIARNKLEVEDLKEHLDAVDKKIIDEEDDNNLTQKYLEQQRINFVKGRLVDINKKEQELRKDISEHTISQEAADEYLKDYDSYRKHLLNYLAKNTTFGNIEEVREEIEKIENGEEQDTKQLEASFNDFIQQIQDIEKNTEENESAVDDKEDNTPKKSIQDLVNKKIDLENSIAAYEKEIPNTEKGYQKIYDEIALGVDKLTRDRLNKAVDKVNTWLEQQEDQDKAIEDLVTGNVPESIKKERELLKLGHHTTREWVAQINMASDKIRKTREEQKKKDNKTVVAGSTITEEKKTKVKNKVEEKTKSDETVVIPETPKKEKTQEELDEEKLAKSQQNESKKLYEEFVVPEPDKSKSKEQSKLDLLITRHVVKIFRENKSLYTKFKDTNENQESKQQIFDDLIDKIIENSNNTLEDETVRESLKNNLANVISFMETMLGNTSKSNKYAIEIANNLSFLESAIDSIEDAKLTEYIEKFLQSYCEEKHIPINNNTRTRISLTKLFNHLISKDGIGINESKKLFFAIQDYITRNNDKFYFTDKKEVSKYINNPSLFFNEIVNNKGKREILATGFHIKTTRQARKEDTKNKFIFEILRNPKGHIGYAHVMRRKGSSTPVGIVFTNSTENRNFDETECGFVGWVVPNSKGTGFTLATQEGSIGESLTYSVRVEDGEIVSNVDSFFRTLINHENAKEDKELWDKLWDICDELNKGDTDLRTLLGDNYDEQDSNAKQLIDLFVKTGLLTKNADGKIGNGIAKLSDASRATNIQILRSLINKANSVIFYNNADETADDFMTSYDVWLNKLFDNYAQTYEMQKLLKDESKQVTVEITDVSDRKCIILPSNKELDITTVDGNEGRLTGKHLVVVKDGIIVDETDGTTYPNRAGFAEGTMGLLIDTKSNGAPIMALFTQSNKVAAGNVDFAKAVRAELTSLLKGYQEGTISFDEMYNKLSDLVSGPNIGSDTLFYGYTLMKVGDDSNPSICLVNDNENEKNRGRATIRIYKYINGTKENSTGITHYTYDENGNRFVKKTSIGNKTDGVEKFIEDIVNELMENLTFNKTYFTVKHKENDYTEKEHIQKEGGKLTIKLGGKTFKFNNFAEFALWNNAFKTSQGVSKTGSLFEESAKSASLTVNIVTKEKSTTEAKSVTKSAANYVKSEVSRKDNVDKKVNTEGLLEAAGYSREEIATLLGEHGGIPLIDREVYYDSKLNNAEFRGDKSTAKVFIPKVDLRKKDSVYKNARTLARVLMHETLHKQFHLNQGNNNRLFSNKRIVDDVLETYEEFVEHIKKDLADEISNLHDAAVAINKVFNIDGTVKGVSPFTVDEYSKKIGREKESDEEKRQRFAEEFLVESLTQGTLMQYLNKVDFSRDVIIEDNEEKKSLFQKIIDALLKLFGIRNLENNSILARQYEILGNKNIEDSTVTDETSTTTDAEATNTTTDSNKLPVKEQPSEDTPQSPTDESVATTDTNTTDTDTTENSTTKKPSRIRERGKGHRPRLDFNDDRTSRLSAIGDIDNVFDREEDVITMESSVGDIETVDEVKIDSFVENRKINTFGLRSVNDMEDFVNSFPHEIRPKLRSMIDANELKYSCQ